MQRACPPVPHDIDLEDAGALVSGADQRLGSIQASGPERCGPMGACAGVRSDPFLMLARQFILEHRNMAQGTSSDIHLLVNSFR